MKKKKIIPICIIVIISIVVCTVLIIKFSKKQLVYVSNWDGKENRYAICEIEDNDSVRTMYGECWTSFASHKSLDAIVKTNEKDFVKDITFGDGGLSFDAKLFFNDNNYYVIYYEEALDIYYARCCNGVIYDGRIRDIYLPMPVYTTIGEEFEELEEEFGDRLVDHLFNFCTFDEAVEFYERYTNGYITIDIENQKITVPGYYNKTDEILEDFFTMDWKNKSYTYIDMEGKTITYDEDGYHEN